MKKKKRKLRANEETEKKGLIGELYCSLGGEMNYNHIVSGFAERDSDGYRL
jgi:hypothetical protein